MSEISKRRVALSLHRWLPKSAAATSSEQVNLMALVARVSDDSDSLAELGYDSLTALRHHLAIDETTFETYAQLGMLYFGKLRMPIELVRKLGFARAKLLRPVMENMLYFKKPHVARRIVSHCVNVSLAELENADFLARLAEDAIEGNLPEVADQHSQGEQHDAGELLQEEQRQDVLSTLVKQIVLGPKTRFPKPPADFIVEPRVWLQLTMAVNLPSHVLMVGPAGCGKTELVGKLAAATGRQLARFSFGAMSDPRSSIIGTMHFHPDKGTVFSMSRFAKAIQTPRTVILLDELNRCDRDAFNLLIPLLDGQKYLSLDEAQDSPVVQVADDVCFIASANVGAEYSGARALDAAIRDRFGTQIAMDYPPVEKEIQLLRNRYSGVTDGQASQLVDMARQQRRLAGEGEFEAVVSTRMLLATAEKIHFGIGMADAIEFGLTNHFSGEGGVVSDRVRFRQLTQRYLNK